MNILVVSPGYPSKKSIYVSSFVHNQVKTVKKQLDTKDEIVVFSIVPWIPAWISKLLKKYRNIDSHSRYYYEGVNVYQIRIFMLPKNKNILSMGEQTYRRILKKIRKIKLLPDIIHSHGAVHTGYAGSKISIKLSIPNLLTIHGSDVLKYPQISPKVEARLCNTLTNTKTIICASNFLKNHILNKYSVESKTIYTGIDLSLFYSKKLPKMNGRYKLLYVGNLIESKGVLDLLEAFQSLKNTYPKLSLTFIGKGYLTDYIMLISKQVKDISLLGPIENSILPDYISDFDILILPSHYEGLGMVLIEALSLGKPVIGANTGGIPEIVNEKTGLLFNPGNITDLTDCIEKIVTGEVVYNPNELVESVHEKFDIVKNSQELINQYRKAIGNNHENI